MDAIQQRLTEYALGLNYEDLPDDIVHIAKLRLIDTLGALIGGFDGEPCRIARAAAGLVSSPFAATIVGTRDQTSAEMAAFNGATARYVEMNDVYHWPGSGGGHPSDVVMPVLAVAEPGHSSGRDLITSLVLAYDIYLRLSDTVRVSHQGFDATNYAVLGTVVAAGKLLGLSQAQLAQAISMAVVANAPLGQARTGALSMWKAVAAGQAGKAAVFAALLAREGMEGPDQPFEGAAGWNRAVAGGPFALEVLGGNGTPFKIADVIVKPRSSCASTISSILAAEQAGAPLQSPTEVERVTVEVYAAAKRGMGTGEHLWHPETRETADHSIPYVVTATLLDGTVGPAQFYPDRMRDPQLQRLLQKVEVVANDEFTAAYERLPVEHRTRVTVVTRDGQRHIGEVSGLKGDVTDPMSDAEIEEKFRRLTEAHLGGARVRSVLDRLWNLEALADVAEVPAAFAR